MKIQFEQPVHHYMIALMLIGVDIIFYGDSAANKMSFGDGLACLKDLCETDLAS